MKIFAIGMNYLQHTAELDGSAYKPEAPVIFTKADSALLKDGNDFVYVHVEAPDEMAHQGLTMDKVKSIEYLDSRIIAPVLQALEESGEDFRMLVLPDHPNLLRLRTHVGDPVPYVLYDSTRQAKKLCRYSEAEAMASGNRYDAGYLLMQRFLQTND